MPSTKLWFYGMQKYHPHPILLQHTRAYAEMCVGSVEGERSRSVSTAVHNLYIEPCVLDPVAKLQGHIVLSVWSRFARLSATGICMRNGSGGQYISQQTARVCLTVGRLFDIRHRQALTTLLRHRAVS